MQNLTEIEIKNLEDRKARYKNGLCPNCKSAFKKWFVYSQNWCPLCACLWDIIGDHPVKTVGKYSQADYNAELVRRNKQVMKDGAT